MTTIDDIRNFYDRFGRRQDWQGFYEDAALEAMVAHADFAHARAVVELGCGTGRLAARLLTDYLPSDASYIGLDVSNTMVSIASRRLRRFGSRAQVLHTSGTVPGELGVASADRFVATYVFDLLTEEATEGTLCHARRLLTSDGLLAAVSITEDVHGVSRVVMRAWHHLFNSWPLLTGYCRPVRLVPRLLAGSWELVWRGTESSFGIASEIIVARPIGEDPCVS